MNFVQAGFLAALGALVIPVIVHLLFKRRSRKVQLGTLRFLREVIEQSSRRKKIKRWILLGLRLGAVAILVMLFARPYFAVKKPAGQGRHVVLLIDKSATMQLQSEGQRLVDVALNQAQEVLRAASENTTAEVAWFDHAVTPVTDSKQQAGQISLKAPGECFGATNYSAALMWARDRMVATDAAKKDLYVITDLQQSGFAANSLDSFPEGVNTQIRDVGRLMVSNISVATTSAESTLIRPGDPFRLAATISNEGAFPIEEQIVTLTLDLMGSDPVVSATAASRGSDPIKSTRSAEKRMKLEAGALVTADFEIEKLTPGLWQGTIQLQSVTDDLAFDNLRHVAVMVDDQIPVLIVDGRPSGTPILAGSYFLDAALRLAPSGQKYDGSPYQTTVVPYDNGSSLPELDRYQIVVLANVSDLSKADAAKLQTFTKAGGGVLVFCGDNVEKGSCRNLNDAELTVGQIAGPELATDLPWRFTSWDEKHVVMKPFNDPQHGDLRRLAFRGVTRIQLNDASSVIAAFRDDVPAVVERTLGDGRVLWFTSSCDRQWSDWTRSRLFLPFVHSLAGRLCGLSDGGPVREVLIDSDHKFSGDAIPGVIARGRFWEVVNCSPRESEGEHCSIDEFGERFGLTLSHGETDTVAEPSAVAQAGIDLRQDELWPWCLVALMGILLCESFLANRTLA